MKARICHHPEPLLTLANYGFRLPFTRSLRQQRENQKRVDYDQHKRGTTEREVNHGPDILSFSHPCRSGLLLSRNPEIVGASFPRLLRQKLIADKSHPGAVGRPRWNVDRALATEELREHFDLLVRE